MGKNNQIKEDKKNIKRKETGIRENRIDIRNPEGMHELSNLLIYLKSSETSIKNTERNSGNFANKFSILCLCKKVTCIEINEILGYRVLLIK